MYIMYVNPCNFNYGISIYFDLASPAATLCTQRAAIIIHNGINLQNIHRNMPIRLVFIKFVKSPPFFFYLIKLSMTNYRL